jgi:hypothetical protein
MKASVVAYHGLPRIRGCPPKLDLGCRIIKSTGYSHESIETMTSSTTPLGLPLTCLQTLV